MDIYTVHISLNHVEESMAITDMYIERDRELITRANDKVIAFFAQFLPNICPKIGQNMQKKRKK